MSHIKTFDHVGITVADLDLVTAFFADLGLEVEGRRPDHEPGSPTAMANELGLRSICFQVDDLQGAVGGLAAKGHGLVGGIGQYENIWHMAQVRGPEGIVVSLSERIG